MLTIWHSGRCREDILDAVDASVGGQPVRSDKSSDEAEPSSAAKVRQAASSLIMAATSTQGTQVTLLC